MAADSSPSHDAALTASDGAGFETVIDPAIGFFESPWISHQLETRQALADMHLQAKSFDHVFTLDLVSPPSDAADLAADYGPDGAQLVILEGAMRGPRFGSPTSAEAYWQAILDFFAP